MSGPYRQSTAIVVPGVSVLPSRIGRLWHRARCTALVAALLCFGCELPPPKCSDTVQAVSFLKPTTCPHGDHAMTTERIGWRLMVKCACKVRR